jgi:hypothetical protein
VRAQEFLGGYALAVKEKVDARKFRIGPTGLESVLAGVKVVLASNGRTVTRFDLARDPPDRAVLLAAMIGHTGNLRAPTLKRRGMLVVRYHADTMAT